MLKTKAFSLFELLIVIGIIGILATISYPIYTQHAARVHCQQAQIALVDMAHRLEQEHSLTHDSHHFDITLLIPDYAQHLPYHFSLSQATHNAYTLHAVATQPNGLETRCQLLTWDSQ